MIRDTFFSGRRFMNLCRKELIENWRTNLLRLVMIYGILTIIFVWYAIDSYNYWEENLAAFPHEDPCQTFEWGVAWWVFVLAGMLSASFIMERMKGKTGRIAMLMTPATPFEKYITRWLIFTFGYILLFCIVLKMADWTRVLIAVTYYSDLEPIGPISFGQLIERNHQHWAAVSDWREAIFVCGGYFVAQSLFVLGSSLWPKNAFVKTVAACVVVVVAYVGIGIALGDALFGGKHVDIEDPSLSEEEFQARMSILFYAVALFNWTLAYFRFKESEIIQRW